MELNNEGIPASLGMRAFALVSIAKESSHDRNL